MTAPRSTCEIQSANHKADWSCLQVSIANLTITNSRGRVLLHVIPNAFPTTKVITKRDIGDDSIVEFVQDPETSLASPSPSFILRLSNEDDLIFNFTFILRQPQTPQTSNTAAIGPALTTSGSSDTVINKLTHIFAPNFRDIDNLSTREFHADPNFHKNPNVEHVGKFSTDGKSSIQFDWAWKWRPPKAAEDRGGGWRNSCSVRSSYPAHPTSSWLKMV
ncbi:MAG: hypothetical protein M1827_000775 [Pycnora praestabilis]|nr:MAG: hypothetical protein M1827_000775 [Pycnora praestabilis]